MPLRIFLGIMIGMGFMGAGIGFGAAFDLYARERQPEPPPTCNVRHRWSVASSRYHFTLLRNDHDVIGRFGDFDAAASAAINLSCKLVP